MDPAAISDRPTKVNFVLAKIVSLKTTIVEYDRIEFQSHQQSFLRSSNFVSARRSRLMILCKFVLCNAFSRGAFFVYVFQIEVQIFSRSSWTQYRSKVVWGSSGDAFRRKSQAVPAGLLHVSRKHVGRQPVRTSVYAARVEEKFPKENFRVNREMRNEISVYESILSRFWAKMVSKCRENSVKIWILGFRF